MAYPAVREALPFAIILKKFTRILVSHFPQRGWKCNKSKKINIDLVRNSYLGGAQVKKRIRTKKKTIKDVYYVCVSGVNYWHYLVTF